MRKNIKDSQKNKISDWNGAKNIASQISVLHIFSSFGLPWKAIVLLLFLEFTSIISHAQDNQPVQNKSDNIRVF